MHQQDTAATDRDRAGLHQAALDPAMDGAGRGGGKITEFAHREFVFPPPGRLGKRLAMSDRNTQPVLQSENRPVMKMFPSRRSPPFGQCHQNKASPKRPLRFSGEFGSILAS